jgi:hypothetical protein
VGAGFDYTVTDNMVTIAENSNGFATVTVRVDGVALEPDETFQLKLVPNPQQNPLPDVSRIFCLDTLYFVIEDGTGIIIILYVMHVQEWLLCMHDHTNHN